MSDLSDRELYPQVLDTQTAEGVWHRRADTDTDGGPDYLTRCGKTIRTVVVNPADGVPELWEVRCAPCYAKE